MKVNVVIEGKEVKKKNKRGTINKWRFNGHNNTLILDYFYFPYIIRRKHRKPRKHRIHVFYRIIFLVCRPMESMYIYSVQWPHISDSPICNLKTQWR